MVTTSNISRRGALGLLGAGPLAAGLKPAQAQLAAPAVRRKARLTYWNWADNPNHLKISTDAIDRFNKSQDFIEVTLNANMAVQESRQKLVVAFAAGAAPDVINTVQYWLQDYFENGILQPLGTWFDQWDGKADFFPSILKEMHSKPNQPILYVPQTTIPFFMYYRADWLKQTGLPVFDTFDQYLAMCKATTHAPDRYGAAIRGQGYSGVQVVSSIWRSAGVEFIDDQGNVDFDSPAAIDVTDKWAGMVTRDHTAQPTAVNDGYRELFALMERQKCGSWIYGPHASPALMAVLGDTIQAANNPRVGDKHYMLANTEGPMMVTSSKEKEAAWELIKFLTSGDTALLFTINRAVPTVRPSLAQNPGFQSNRFIKMSLDMSDSWWSPPYSHSNWANFQDKITPFWQQLLQKQLTPAQFNQQGAAFLRGDA